MKQEYCQQKKAQSIKNKLKDKKRQPQIQNRSNLTKNKYNLRDLEFITTSYVGNSIGIPSQR